LVQWGRVTESWHEWSDSAPSGESPAMTPKHSLRVLIVSAVPMRAASATGISMLSLFSNFSRCDIAQIYDDELEPDSECVATFHRLNSGDLFHVRVGRRLLGFRKSGVGGRRAAKGSVVAGVPSPASFSGGLGAIGDIAPFKLPRSLLSWAREFSPDLIYSPLGSVRMMNVCVKLSKSLDVPVVPHFMDDWPSTTYARGVFMWLPRFAMNQALRQVISRASAGMAISPDMAAEFEARYKLKFSPFMNCVFVPELEPVRAPDSDGQICFGFVGGMHLNRWRCLLKVAEALQLCFDDGFNLRFELYAPQKDIVRYGPLFKQFGVVTTLATIRPDQVDERLRAMHVLVHTESFSPEDSRYTRLSISTKIPQYLAAGRPILCFGPRTLASVRHVIDCGAGLAVDSEHDMLALKESVATLQQDLELRKRLGGSGYRSALDHHNIRAQSARFVEALAGAASR
jgi:hypothetical protein